MNPPPKIHTGETHFAHAGFSEETETPSRSGTFRIGRATGFSDAPGNYQVRVDIREGSAPTEEKPAEEPLE